MAGFNLSDDKFAGSTFVPFNGGVAGLAKGTATIEKKKEGDKDGVPDYSIVVTDENGGVAKFAYRHKNAEATKGSQEFNAKLLRHFAESVFELKVPNKEFKTITDVANAVFTECMKKSVKVNVFADYGNPGYEKEFLQISEGFNIINQNKGELTKISKRDKLVMTKLVADKDKPSASYSAPTASAGSEDTNGWD